MGRSAAAGEMLGNLTVPEDGQLDSRLLWNCVQMKGDGKTSEDIKTELSQHREEDAKLKVD